MLRFDENGELEIVDKEKFWSYKNSPTKHYNKLPITSIVSYVINIISKKNNYSKQKSYNFLKTLFWTSNLSVEEFEQYLLNSYLNKKNNKSIFIKETKQAYY